MNFSSVYNHAQTFVAGYKNETIEQDIIDAVVVEYVNMLAACMKSNERMHTEDLRSPVRFSNGEPDVSDNSKFALESAKERLLSSCLSNCINEHTYYNNCNGRCSLSNDTAEQIIQMYIDTYLGGKAL